MEKGHIKKRRVTWLIVGIIILVLVAAGYLLFSMSYTSVPEPSVEDFCSSDADCVPASCCHATRCVVNAKAPSCKGAICSQVCAPGSLDCGQGSCGCVNNACKAVLK